MSVIDGFEWRRGHGALTAVCAVVIFALTSCSRETPLQSEEMAPLRVRVAFPSDPVELGGAEGLARSPGARQRPTGLALVS